MYSYILKRDLPNIQIISLHFHSCNVFFLKQMLHDLFTKLINMTSVYSSIKPVIISFI